MKQLAKLFFIPWEACSTQAGGAAAYIHQPQGRGRRSAVSAAVLFCAKQASANGCHLSKSVS